MPLFGLNLFGPSLPKIGLKGRIDLANNLHKYLQIWIIRHQHEENIKKMAFAEFLRASIWGPEDELSSDPVSISLAQSISFMKPFTDKVKDKSKLSKNGTFYPDEIVWLVKQVRKMALPLNIIIPGEEGGSTKRCKILDLSLELYPPKTYSIIYKPYNKKPLNLSKIKNFEGIIFFQSKHLEPTPIPKPKKPAKVQIEPQEEASAAAGEVEEEREERTELVPIQEVAEEEKIPSITEEETSHLSEAEEEEEAIAAPAEEHTEAEEETNPADIEAENREKALEKVFFGHINIGKNLVASFSGKGFEDFLKSGATINDDESGRKIAARKLETFMRSSPGLKRSIEGKEIPEDVMDGLVEMFIYLRSNRKVKNTPTNIKMLLSIAIDELVLVSRDGMPILFKGKLLTMDDMLNINARIVSSKMAPTINASELKYLDSLDPEKLAKLGHTLESFEAFVNCPSIAIKEAKGYKCRKASKKEASAAAPTSGEVEEDKLELEEEQEANSLPYEEEARLIAQEEEASAAAGRAQEEEAIPSDEEEEGDTAPNEDVENPSDTEDEAAPAEEEISAATLPSHKKAASISASAAATDGLSSDEDEEELLPPHILPKHLEFYEVTHSILTSQIGFIDYGDVLSTGLNKESRKKPLKLGTVKVNQQTKSFYCDPQDQTEDRICQGLINEGKKIDGLNGNFIGLWSGAMMAGYVLNSKIQDFIAAHNNFNFDAKLVHEHNRITPLKALIHYFVESICTEMNSQNFSGDSKARAEQKGQFLIDELPKKFEIFAKSAAKKGILFDFELLASDLYIGKPEECINMLSLELFDIPKLKSIFGWAEMPFDAAVISTMNIFKEMAYDAYFQRSSKQSKMYDSLHKEFIGYVYSHDFPAEDAFAGHPNYEEIIGFARGHEDSSA